MANAKKAQAERKKSMSGKEKPGTYTYTPVTSPMTKVSISSWEKSCRIFPDFRAYADCQDRLYKRISDASELGRLSIMNTAQSGFFAADRAIAQYAKEIWHID